MYVILHYYSDGSGSPDVLFRRSGPEAIKCIVEMLNGKKVRVFLVAEGALGAPREIASNDWDAAEVSQ